MQIAGVGFNPPEDNAAWAAEEGFEFELWTDDQRTLSIAYGAADDADAVAPARVTVILDADGELVLEYLSDIVVTTHPSDVLADCEALFGGR